MIEKMSLHYSFTNPASVHDEEALTALELAGRQGAKINEIIDSQNELVESTPGRIASEVKNHIEKGTFDEQIDKHTDEIVKAIERQSDEFNVDIQRVEGRVDSLVGATVNGSTTLDAEVIDIRTDEYGNTHVNAGTAVRKQGEQCFNIQNALAYIANNMGVSVEPLNDGTLYPDGGYKVHFYDVLNIVLRGRSDLNTSDWGVITSNISDKVTISENGKECEIICAGYRVNLVFDTLTDKLKIEHPIRCTKNDIHLFIGNYSGVNGGILYGLYLNHLKGDKKDIEYLMKKNTEYFYVANDKGIELSFDRPNGIMNIHFESYLCRRDTDTHTDLMWSNQIDSLGDRVTIGDPGAVITLKAYERLVYRKNTGKLHVVYYNSINEGNDTVLVNNGWATICGGELAYWISKCADNKLNTELTEVKTDISGSTFEKLSDNKIYEFSGLENGSGDISKFMYFTDPHFFWHDAENREALFHNYMNHLSKTYDRLNLDFCACGGDWFNHDHTKEEAIAGLMCIGGYTRKNFERFYHVIGNHDYNYQLHTDGVNGWSPYILTASEIANSLNLKNTYYTFKEKSTTYIVLDTGVDWSGNSAITTHVYRQLPWLASELSKVESEHVVLMGHFTFTDVTFTNMTGFFNKVMTLAQGFNEKRVTTIEEGTFDFTGCTGRVEFVLTGHTHADNVSVKNGIPIITTRNTQVNNQPCYDLFNVDYTRRKINIVRVGMGENRTVDI